jgi:hypothetical protein
MNLPESTFAYGKVKKEFKIMRVERNDCGRILLAEGLLSVDTKIRVGYTRTFILLKDDGRITVHCYRENWNGWHDLFEILPSGEKGRDVCDVDSSQGICE